MTNKKKKKHPDNVNKAEFNLKFAKYTQISNIQESNSYYERYLHKDMMLLIDNALYSYNFEVGENMERFLKEDAKQDLLLHFLMKKDKLFAYGQDSNWYNLIFTLFRNKFFDMLRSKSREDKRLSRLLQTLKERMPEALEIEEQEVC